MMCLLYKLLLLIIIIIIHGELYVLTVQCYWRCGSTDLLLAINSLLYIYFLTIPVQYVCMLIQSLMKFFFTRTAFVLVILHYFTLENEKRFTRYLGESAVF